MGSVMNKIYDIMYMPSEPRKELNINQRKFCYDTSNSLLSKYDFEQDIHEEKQLKYDNLTVTKNLTDVLDYLHNNSQDSWFKYFLDGSRYVYKVAELIIDDYVYPVLAGQISIACCRREGKIFQKELFDRKIVMAMPSCILNSDDSESEQNIKEEINKATSLVNKKLKIEDMIFYDTKTENLDCAVVSKIQKYMVDKEDDYVFNFMKSGKLKENVYLIKDGTLLDCFCQALNKKDVSNEYQYIIWISKSFSPDKCKEYGIASSAIAKLKPNERTPVKFIRRGNWMVSCVWYIRLREGVKNIFDGVIKVEKLILRDEKLDEKFSELIERISAFLLMERNPVAYGRDVRWANHIYPIYITERFAKSQHLSHDMFLSLF